MQKPYLQIALDTESLEQAFDVLSGGLDEVVDIIEVGTMLMLMEGMHAVRIMRAAYPQKLMVADFKLAVTHFGPKVLEGNTQFATVFSPAREDIKKAILEQATERGQTAQLELYGDWTFEQLQTWREMGYEHIIYQRPRYRTGPWTQEDVDTLKKICDMGFQVTATGGVSYNDLDLLAGLPLFAIICGRSIRNAVNPVEEARRVQARIAELWTD